MTERQELNLHALAAGGDAVGRDDGGRVTFVSGGAPGDRVRVELLEERKSFARAQLLQVLEPSPDRVEPRCPLFAAGTCGGCQWQHVAIEAQRRAKDDIARAALRRLSSHGLTLLPILAPVADYEWRRRARFTWYGGRKRALGFHPPRSHHVTDVEECPQLELGLATALTRLRAVLLPALRGRGELEVLWNGREVHVAIHGDVPRPAVEALAALEGVAGVSHGKKLLGAPVIALPEGGSAGAADFVQASHQGNAALRGLVREWAGDVTGQVVVDLFAGNGNLTQELLAARKVIAVEEREPKAPPVGVDFRVGKAEDLVGELIGQPVDLLVLDPPRTGAKELMPALLKLAPGRILYVSCDPATLARDAEVLVLGGYRPTRAVPMDLMPQTAHIEVLLELVRV